MLMALLIVLAMFSLGACSAGGGGESSTSAGSGDGSAAPPLTAAPAPDDGSYKSESEAASDMVAGESSESSNVNAVADPGAAGDVTRKEIKNGSVSLSVKDVAKSYADLSALVTSIGGYEFSKNEYGGSYGLTVDLVVKIPPEKLKDFESGLKKAVGEDAIRHYQVSSEDITSDYYDTATHLDSLKNTLDRYREMIKDAKTVTDMLAIQQEISDIEIEMDSLAGEIRMWDRLVEYATMSVNIYSNETPAERSWRFDTASDFFNAIGNGFMSVARGLGTFVLWLLVALVSALPVLIPIAIILLIIRWFVRRRRRDIASGKRQPKRSKKSKKYMQPPPQYCPGQERGAVQAENPVPGQDTGQPGAPGRD